MGHLPVVGGFGYSGTLDLEVVNHVHNRIERFVYRQGLDNQSTPIAYLENPRLDSRTSVHITNRTYGVDANAPKLVGRRAPWTRITGTTYTGKYEYVAVTNQALVDERGVSRPLFFKHELPENTVEAEIYSVESGNRIDVDSGYTVDLGARSVFTNYQNFYDESTGAYKLFWVVSTDSSGDTYHELLNPQGACREATWSDIVAGVLTTDYPLYTVSKTADGWTFYFNSNDTWWVKPIDRSLIQPLGPEARDPEESWFLRITDGDLTSRVNNSARRYYIPEYDSQPFAPSKPYIYSTYGTLLYVSSKVLKVSRENLAVDPDAGRHLQVWIYDAEDTLVKLFTTDASLDGERYNNSSVLYENRIQGWDNHGGFISLDDELLPGYTYKATYYYEADDLEYTLLDLNPIQNPEVLKNSYVFYVVPDVSSTERAVQHLVINDKGIITYCSQSDTNSPLNLQLLTSGGAYNTNTVVGMPYVSDTVVPNFLDSYTAGYATATAADVGYMVLAEVVVVDPSLVENQFVADVRRRGAVIDPDVFETVLKKNPRVLQSILGVGEEGEQVPENAVMVIKAPITLLEDYGGVLTEDQAEEYLRAQMHVTGYLVIDWEYPTSELSGFSTTATQVDLSCPWVGGAGSTPTLSYKIYRRGSPTDAWALLTTKATPAIGAGVVTHSDVGLTTGDVWYYTVRIDDGTNEYPPYNSIGVKVS